jgi:hypothetical protein
MNQLLRSRRLRGASAGSKVVHGTTKKQCLSCQLTPEPIAGFVLRLIGLVLPPMQGGRERPTLGPQPEFQLFDD